MVDGSKGIFTQHSLSSYHIYPLVEPRSSLRRERSKQLYWPRWSCHVELGTKYIFSRRSRSLMRDAPDIARLTILAHLETKMRVKGIFIFLFWLLSHVMSCTHLKSASYVLGLGFIAPCGRWMITSSAGLNVFTGTTNTYSSSASLMLNVMFTFHDFNTYVFHFTF